MEIDEDKIDDAVLALLWLTLHNERCAWKGFDWATTDRLHKKGMIGDPVNKSKSLILTDEGLERCSSPSLRCCTSPKRPAGHTSLSLIAPSNLLHGRATSRELRQAILFPVSAFQCRSAEIDKSDPKNEY